MKKDILLLENQGRIALCTLWTKKEDVLKRIPEEIKKKIRIAGTLYTSYGINFLLETLDAVTEVNVLILFGNDLSTSGKDLVRLFKGEVSFNLVLDKKKVDKLVKKIRFLDLRNKSFDELVEAIKRIPNKTSRRRRLNLRVCEKTIDSFPEVVCAVPIYEESLFKAWVKVLNQIVLYGFKKFSEYGEEQLELLNVVVTLRIKNSFFLEKEFLKYFDYDDFKKHEEETLRGIRKRGVEYTYGSRALNHRIAGNQIQEMVDKLSKKPYSRRAIAILWDHEKDKKSPFPPCLIVIQGIISNDKYYHTVFIRSNDMDKGWPINAYAQVRLAEYIVNEINKKSKTDYRVGGITTISCSAHLYKHSWERIKKILKENKSALESFVPDERGNVFISASKDGIELQHRTQDNQLLRRFSGSVEEVYSAAKSLCLIPEHMLYLGRILGRFEKNF